MDRIKYLDIYWRKDKIGSKVGNKVIFNRDLLNKNDIWYFDKMFGMDGDEASFDIVYRKFILDRYGTKGRSREKEFLKAIGYNKRPIDDLEVIMMTNGKLVTDMFWLDFGEGEIFYGVNF